MTKHFRERVAERIGPDVDADQLAELLFLAIDTGRDDLVQFVTRISKDGRRLFKFRVLDGRVFFALLNTNERTAITVLRPDLPVSRVGKPSLIPEGAQ